MTETEQFIEDAVKGGWRPDWHWEEEYHTVERIINDLTEHKTEWYSNYYDMVVDNQNPLLAPTVWQAVGKTRGWNEKITYYNTFTEGKENNDPWRLYFHSFIDHLAEGSSIEQALKAIK